MQKSEQVEKLIAKLEQAGFTVAVKAGVNPQRHDVIVAKGVIRWTSMGTTDVAASLQHTLQMDNVQAEIARMQNNGELAKLIAADMIDMVEVDRELQELMRYHRRVEVLSVALKEIAFRTGYTHVVASTSYSSGPVAEHKIDIEFTAEEVDWLQVSVCAWDLYESVRTPNYRVVLDIAYPYENVAEVRVRSIAVDHKKIIMPVDACVNVMDENGESTYTINANGASIEGGPCDQGYAMWLYGVLDTLVTRFDRDAADAG